MFCRIYITGESLNSRELLFSISHLLHAKTYSGVYIEKAGLSIEIRPNKECDKRKAKGFPDGFLYFPFSVDVDIQDDIEVVMAAEEVGRILTFLWANKYTAIASCDFEDLLPENGGYKSTNIPWIGE